MVQNEIFQQETICAVATPQGVGAIAVIRVSGEKTFEIVNSIFRGGSRGKDLTKVATHTVHFGTIRANSTIIDEVLIAVFKNPKSFTKEDVVEISCHGSDFIIQQILKLLIKHGARMAKAGEFTQRAFLNGAFDLVQAEAVADLIASDSEATHRVAMNQMRGGFSKQLLVLREELVNFASLVELELDFGEEDVEFAERDDLRKLITKIQAVLRPLIASFDAGNVMKNGVPVAIIGSPNVGKSTLLNALLNEEKAIVTPIAGTTRDVIEDVMIIDGIKFRFIDTAGIRETNDVVEAIGISRSKESIRKAEIVLFLYEAETNVSEFDELKVFLAEEIALNKVIYVRNKIDKNKEENPIFEHEISISAKEKQHLEILKEALLERAKKTSSDTVITNLRHFEHLTKTSEALDDVLQGLNSGITGDFIAQDIRFALHHLGELTGTITSDDLLVNIFSKFCIGK